MCVKLTSDKSCSENSNYFLFSTLCYLQKAMEIIKSLRRFTGIPIFCIMVQTIAFIVYVFYLYCAYRTYTFHFHVFVYDVYLSIIDF